MQIIFDKESLRNLYQTGNSGDKKHRFQPQIVRKYIKVVDLMQSLPDVSALRKYNSLHYEKMLGDKTELSSVRVNDQYRIEFKERMNGTETVATICNIVELSNHYK